MRRVLLPLLDLFYPAFCRFCGSKLGTGEKFFCGRCAGGIRTIQGPLCTVCGKAFEGAGESHDCFDCARKAPPYDVARAHAVYEGAVKEAIHLYKYGRIRSLKGFLGGLAAVSAAEWFGDAEVAVPVPLHKKRLRQRGFNQSLFLAQSAARAVGAGFSVDGLVRTRHTKPQVELGPEDREENVRGAFAAARPGDFRGRKVLLVDDVYTTGATVKECSRVLRKAGAERVYILTIARV